MSSAALRRTLLTTRTFPRSTAAFKLPIANSKTFSTSTSTLFHRSRPNMSKDGVHNISSATEIKSNIRGAPAGKLAVLDCFATWCGPCKIIAPKIVEFSEKYPDVSFYKIDVDEQPEVAQELSVRAMPTFFFFKDGEIVADVVGANPAAVEAAIVKHQ